MTERQCEVECETGRLTVHLYGGAFSSLRPKERIWEASLADRILGLVSDLSFTKATGYINGFLHRSGDETLRVKTVEEFMERMGRGMDAAYKSVSDKVLSEAGIDTAEGVVPEGAAVPEEARIPKLPEPASKESVEEVARRYNQGREEGASINVDAIGIPPRRLLTTVFTSMSMTCWSSTRRSTVHQAASAAASSSATPSRASNMATKSTA